MNELEDLIPRVVDAVAEAGCIEPVTLESPLAEVIDPDALETLIEDSATSNLEVQFAYRGHDIVVDASGHVQVD
jgi:hypothetical protein